MFHLLTASHASRGRRNDFELIIALQSNHEKRGVNRDSINGVLMIQITRITESCAHVFSVVTIHTSLQQPLDSLITPLPGHTGQQSKCK